MYLNAGHVVFEYFNGIETAKKVFHRSFAAATLFVEIGDKPVPTIICSSYVRKQRDESCSAPQKDQQGSFKFAGSSLKGTDKGPLQVIIGLGSRDKAKHCYRSANMRPLVPSITKSSD